MVLDVRGGGGGGVTCWRSCPAAASSTSAPWPALRGAQMRLRLARDGAGITGCVMGSVPPFALDPALAWWSTKTCWPTRRCSSTPAGSTVRWSSTTKDWLAVAKPRVARIAAKAWDGLRRLALERPFTALVWGDLHRGPPSWTSSSPLRQRLIGWGRQLKPMLLALGFVLIVRTVVAEPYRVPSPSMVPTLLVGDELIGSKFAYGYGKYSSPIGLMPDFSGRLFAKHRSAATSSSFACRAIRRRPM